MINLKKERGVDIGSERKDEWRVFERALKSKNKRIRGKGYNSLLLLSQASISLTHLIHHIQHLTFHLYPFTCKSHAEFFPSSLHSFRVRQFLPV